jgi:gliding motility-associated-like protein
MVAQCDVSISNWDAISGDIVIDVINSENCGCNEFTTIGNTCENSANPSINNNTTISHIVLGLHVEGMDYNWGCLNANNHPGWTFKAFSLFGNQVLESGESWSANIYDSPVASDCWAEILANDSLCTEIVVWQINLSQTSHISEGGWAVNMGALQTQSYPDVDLSNNTAVYCALPACDTIYIDVVEYIYDTTFVELPPDTIILTEVDTLIEYVQLPPDTVQVIDYIYLTDTVYVETIVYQYIVDTTYVDVIVDNYIYITDTLTLTEYILSIEYIDCETGEPCEDDPGIDVCDDNSIYIPNTFTPNNDGVNDVFYAITDVTCWLTWNLQIYNRWGTLVKEMNDPTDYWTGVSFSGHWLCPDGVYTWKLKATEEGASTQLNGLVTIFR